jgi:hypothetical protein
MACCCTRAVQIAGNTSAAFFIWFAGLLFWPYFLMQTGVGYFRVYAMVNGLLGSKKSGTWKVGAAVGGHAIIWHGRKCWSMFVCYDLQL